MTTTTTGTTTTTPLVYFVQAPTVDELLFLLHDNAARANFLCCNARLAENFRTHVALQCRAVNNCWKVAVQKRSLRALVCLQLMKIRTDKKALIDLAAANGDLEIVQWLHVNYPRIKHGRRCTVNAMNRAAGNGHLHVVQWLYRNRDERCTYVASDLAAANGHLSVLVWLKAVCYPGLSCRAISGAARNGHLGVLQWIDGERVMPGFATRRFDLEQAIIGGHLQVLQWLILRFVNLGHAYGRRPPNLLDLAVNHGHMHIAVWLCENSSNLGNQVEFDNPSQQTLVLAARHGDIGLVRWLVGRRKSMRFLHGVTLANVVNEAARNAPPGSDVAHYLERLKYSANAVENV